MNRLQLTLSFSLASLLLISAVSAQDIQSSTNEKHDGTPPRTAADKYPAHAEKDGLKIGAALLTKKEISQDFAADLNRCCLVVEVAIYPKKDDSIQLSLVDFSLLKEGSDKPVRPESPTVVASRLEKKKSPTGSMAPTGAVGVGSGTYIDPNGQAEHVHGVSAGVGVSTIPPNPNSAHDRDVMEWELTSKCLQEDKASMPIAGYLYFPIPKSDRDAKFTLTYYSDSGPIVLNLH